MRYNSWQIVQQVSANIEPLAKQ